MNEKYADAKNPQIQAIIQMKLNEYYRLEIIIGLTIPIATIAAPAISRPWAVLNVGTALQLVTAVQYRPQL